MSPWRKRSPVVNAAFIDTIKVLDNSGFTADQQGMGEMGVALGVERFTSCLLIGPSQTADGKVDVSWGSCTTSYSIDPLTDESSSHFRCGGPYEVQATYDMEQIDRALVLQLIKEWLAVNVNS